MSKQNIGKEIGNYRIISEVARGAFGIVYRAQHKLLSNRFVAIKLLNANVGSSQMRSQFLEEASFLEKLQHRHIIKIYDVGVDEDGFPYIITEFAFGGSLRNYLNLRKTPFLPLEKAVSILEQIGEALNYAHEHDVVHCDLKPENILFNDKDEVLLADFGIASLLGGFTTKSSDPIGTPPYMAPEQFDGKISRQSDQYALGCIAYELLTGRRPFQLDPSAHMIAWAYKHREEAPINLRELNPAIPIHIERTVLKSMAKQRSERHENILAFIKSFFETKEQWVREGDTYCKDKRFREAWGAYGQAIRLDPNDSDIYILKGDMLFNLERYEEALEDYERAQYLNMDNAMAYQKAGITLNALKLYEKAIKAYERARQINPNDVATYKGKGDVLFNLKHYEEAKAVYEKALQFNSNDATIFNQLGRIHKALKSYHDALQAYEKAIALDVHNAIYYRGKADVLRNLKMYEEAIMNYKEVLRLDANDHAAHYGWGLVLRDLNQHKEALTAYEQAIELNHNNANYRRHKGDALFALERHEEALTAYEQAVRLNPKDAAAYNGEAHILCYLKRYEEALAANENATRIAPKIPTTYIVKGDILCGLERYEKAIETYNQAIKLNPRNAVPYAAKGDVFCHLKRYKEALSFYAMAIRHDPKNALLYRVKGNVFYDLKMYEEALSCYEQALTFKANDAAYRGKGDALYGLNRFKEALSAYKQAIQLNNNEASAFRGKGDALYQLKQYEDALASYEQAILLKKDEYLAFKGKGDVFCHMERYQDAITSYDLAMQFNDTDAAIWYGRAEALYHLKNYQDALRAYEQTLRFDRNHAAAYYGKGCILHHLNRYEEALTAYEQTIHLSKDSAAAYLGKGEALFELNRDSEANKSFARADELDLNLDLTSITGKGYDEYKRQLNEEKNAQELEEIELSRFNWSTSAISSYDQEPRVISSRTIDVPSSSRYVSIPSRRQQTRILPTYESVPVPRPTTSRTYTSRSSRREMIEWKTDAEYQSEPDLRSARSSQIYVRRTEKSLLSNLKDISTSLTFFSRLMYSLIGTLFLTIIDIALMLIIFEILGNLVNGWSYIANPPNLYLFINQIYIISCSLFIVISIYNIILWTDFLRVRRGLIMIPFIIITFPVVHFTLGYFGNNNTEEMMIDLLMGAAFGLIIYGLST